MSKITLLSTVVAPQFDDGECQPDDTISEVTLVSTVVAPKFETGRLELEKVTTERLEQLLPYVSRNLCGHPVTDKVLRELCPYLPVPERAFWDGYGHALAIRPKGGVRCARQTGDTDVATIDELEAVLFRWIAE